MKEVLDFASSLQRAAKEFLLYGTPNHPRAREATETLIDHTEAMLRHDRAQIVASRGSLFLQGQLVSHHSPAIDWLIAELAERQLNGFVISKGVTAAELSQVVRIFTLKPPQLESLGGATHLLAEVEATHVRVSETRFDEVRDGEIVVRASQNGKADATGGYDPIATSRSIQHGEEPSSEEINKLARFLVDWIAQMRADALSDSHDQTSPGTTPNEKNAGAPAAAALPEELLEALQSEQPGLMLLQTRLKELGILRGDLDEILEMVAWQNLDIDERVRRSLEGALVFELPLDKLLAFVLDLVRSGRPEDAMRLLDKMASGLFSPSPEQRKAAAGRLQRVVGWIIDPGLPRVIEAMIEKQLLTHFVKESDPQIQRRSQIAFMRLYDTWILRSQLEKALQTLRRLETVAGAAAASTPWKQDLYEELLDRLINEERTKQLLELMYTQDLDTVARVFHPIFVFFGGRAAIRLLEALEFEEDRSRRGRLIKAIKAIGKPALQHLESALRSPTWYLVRNALNVLGDLTAVELIEQMGATLEHEDERVRRASARALGKLGGRRVERFLIDALKANSGETQLDILGALGTLKEESTIDEIVELTKLRRLGRADDPVRLKAIETLGMIGSPKGVAPLADLVRRKGVLGGQEPPIVRKTICLALLAIGSLDAYKEVQSVAESETDRELREELLKALWH